jgi:hypothetical protein
MRLRIELPDRYLNYYEMFEDTLEESRPYPFNYIAYILVHFLDKSFVYSDVVSIVNHKIGARRKYARVVDKDIADVLKVLGSAGSLKVTKV